MKRICDTICGGITADNIATIKTLFQNRYYTITILTLPRTAKEFHMYVYFPHACGNISLFIILHNTIYHVCR